MSEQNNPTKGTETTTTETPQFVTKEDFGKTAAFIRRMDDENKELRSMLSAFIDKSEDGSYKLKATPAPEPTEKATWETEAKQLRDEIKKRDELLAKEKANAANQAKRSAVIESLTANNAVNPARDVVHVLDQVRQNAQGGYVVPGKDEHGLETETDLNTYVNRWLSSNPELVRPSTKQGSGSPNGTAVNIGGSDIGSLANMSEAEYFAFRRKK